MISSSQETRWGQVVLLIGAGVVASFQIGKAPPVLPAIRLELGMDLFLAGWILSTFSIIGLILGPIAGALADTYGYRRFLLWGLVCQAIGSLVGSWANDAAPLLATRILEGFGFLIIAVSAPALILRITHPAKVRFALAAWSCYVPAGVATVMFLAPLFTALFGWRGLWRVNGAILIAYLFLLYGAKGRPAPRPGSKKVGLTQLWADTVMTATTTGPLLLALIFATYTFQWLAVTGFLPTLFLEDYGFSPGGASVLTAIVVAMNVPGNLAGGWLLQRGFRRWRLIASASLILGLCSLIIYSPTIPLFWRYFACLCFSGIGGLPPASAMSGVPIYAPSPRHVATTNGLLIQGSQLGQVLGPPAIAWLVSTTGSWQAAPWLLGGVAAVGAALGLGLAAVGKGETDLNSRD
jgi:MFS family permease